MPTPTEHKTVQARILQYAQEIGWTYVPRAEAEARRGFDPDGVTPEDGAHCIALFRRPAPRPGARLQSQIQRSRRRSLGEFRRLNADITGNRDFLAYLRNQGKFFCADENRELDLTLIDYDDLARPRDQWRNVYEVTEEFYVHNGQLRHARGRGLPHQRHPRAGDRVQERHQGRGHRAGRRSDPPLPRRDAGGDGAGDDLHRHRGDRLLLRRDVEH